MNERRIQTGVFLIGDFGYPITVGVYLERKQMVHKAAGMEVIAWERRKGLSRVV